MMLCPRWLTIAGLLMAGAAFPVFAQSDREVYESTVRRSADVCPGHSNERTTPVARALPVGALRVLLDRSFVLCPDRRLAADAPAVWYGGPGVFAWNPDVPGADKAIIAQVDAMTRREDFPSETLIWNVQGQALQGQVVPNFEPRQGARLRR